MRKPKPLTDEEGEVRELLIEDMKRFRPIADVLPKTSLRKLAPSKETVTLQLSQDVLDSFRATGRGWEQRVDGALREWLTKHAAE